MSTTIDKKLYTPLFQQYLEIKESYNDAFLFFRVGDFYELFFNDAIVGSKELEITLTSKDGGTNIDKVPMAGVPFHAVEQYIEKLTEKGYKVAICEQAPDENNPKLFKRIVTQVITPGTNIDNLYLSEKENNYLGVLEKANNNYNLAYIDLSTGDSYSVLIPNNIQIILSEILKLNIKELVISPQTSSAITNILKDNYNILLSVESNTKTDDYLNYLFDNLKDDEIISCKRLISYVIRTQKRVLLHLKPFIHYSMNDYLSIDSQAVKSLELVESINGERFSNNLFSVLDKCKTAMGSRYLKKSILFPLIKLNQINERLNIVQDLIANQNVSNELSKLLQEVYDLERITARVSFGTLSPRDLIQLRKSLSVIPSIKSILNSSNKESLIKINSQIESFDTLNKLLIDSINDDAPFLLKDGNVIKRGFCKELDQIRDIESTNKDFLLSLEAKEKERTGIKNLKVGYNRVFGYFIEITNSMLPYVKDEYGYIRKQTTTSSERFITSELKERETLILRSADEALALEIKLFKELREECSKNTKSLQTLASNIAQLDMLLSFAVCAKNFNYVRPNFSSYDELYISNGRHAVVEQNNINEFIPNDLIMGNTEKVLLITGPNMSGKSTFMRQNALIIIMAQMGSFVPCDKATLPIFDQIFTRIGSSDNLNMGESTFMTEMKEVNRALTLATDRSLIIFDEVGRGTATYDGLALAQSIIEFIHNKIGAKTLFSTHYHELTTLEESLTFLKNVHVDAKVIQNNLDEEVIFLHKVINGAADKSYGINVASLAHIPQEVTIRAKDILDKITLNKNYDKDLLSPDNYIAPKIINNLKPSEVKVINKIKESSIEDLKPVDALLLLNSLKETLNND